MTALIGAQYILDRMSGYVICVYVSPIIARSHGHWHFCRADDNESKISTAMLCDAVENQDMAVLGEVRSWRKCEMVAV